MSQQIKSNYTFINKMKLNLHETEQMKEKILSSTDKGFSYFIKNAILVILIFLGCWIFTNPEIVINPAQYIEGFDKSSIFSIAILFLIITGIFQLGKSILKENREIIKESQIEQMKETRRKHNEDAFKRMENNPKISMALKDILINLGATRSTVCEIHNGTNTIAGVPFIHLTMTFEEISNEVQYSRDEYLGLNMSRIPFISKHFQQGTWIGSTNEIEKEDKFLASKLKNNDDNYMGFMLIHGQEEPLGILTVAWKEPEDHPNKELIIAEMSKASQKISTLLDK